MSQCINDGIFFFLGAIRDTVDVLAFVIAFSFDDAVFCFGPGYIQSRDFQPELFEHIFLDFFIDCLGYSCCVSSSSKSKSTLIYVSGFLLTN